MKKKKQFTGDVPFDYFGEMLDSDRYHYCHKLTQDNFINGCLALDHYDDATHKWVKKVVTNPPADFEITYLDQPDKYNPNIIATVPYCLHVPNFEFDDRLQYESAHRSRYSVGFIFRSVISGKRYPMFMTEFDRIVPEMDKGILEGRFTFCKRGPSFAIVKI